jgi:hypothetical protein
MTPMDRYDEVKAEIRQGHSRILAAIAGMMDAQVLQKPPGTISSIGFNTWHIARWADADRQTISGRAQVWTAGDYAKAWDMAEAHLGEGDTGTGLSDDEATGVALPAKDRVEEYARSSFAAFEDMLDSLTEADLEKPTVGHDSQHRSAHALILSHLMHLNRHLGMIEALKGIQGLTGTASR